jgi:alpha-tubulin suppressor-like RCC1 family protein
MPTVASITMLPSVASAQPCPPASPQSYDICPTDGVLVFATEHAGGPSDPAQTGTINVNDQTPQGSLPWANAYIQVGSPQNVCINGATGCDFSANLSSCSTQPISTGQTESCQVIFTFTPTSYSPPLLRRGTLPLQVCFSNPSPPTGYCEPETFVLSGTIACAAESSTELSWGSDNDGALGNSSVTTNQTTPVTVALPCGVTPRKIADTANDGYAIGSNGTLYAWGFGSFGELGNGSSTLEQLTPVPVDLPAGVTPVAIAGGYTTGYAIGSNGTLYAWGEGQYGQLGNGSTTAAQLKPVAVDLPMGVTPVAIAAGGTTAYAIGSNNKLYAWGSGPDGELGNGSTAAVQPTPVPVDLPAGVTPVDIAGGFVTGYAIGSNGTLYAWGDGTFGELGNNTVTSPQTTPVKVKLPAGVTPVAIAAGNVTGYAIGSNNKLYAWGSGPDGELGNGSTTTAQLKPVAVKLPAGVTPVAIAGGAGVSSEWAATAYCIGSNRKLYAWGNGADGELGNGSTTAAQLTPVSVHLPAGDVPKKLPNGSPMSSSGYVIVRLPR